MTSPFVALDSNDGQLPKGVNSILITLADGETPPSELRLFAKGVTETTKGPFIFDDEAARVTMARYRELGKDKLPFDYNHAMLAFIISPDSGKAAAWFVPEVRNGELWATSIEWTPHALSALKDREYRFFSPAFRSHYESHRVTELINVALTNLPATKNQKPIVASDTFETDTNRNKPMNAILKLLGVNDENEAHTSLSQLLSERASWTALLASAGTKTIAELSTVFSNLKKANEAMTTERTTEKRNARIAELSTAGRLAPAQHEFARELSDTAFESFVKTLPEGSIAPTPAAPTLALSAPPSGARPTGRGVPVSPATVTLSDEERELAKQFGQDPEALKTVKAELLSGEHPFRYEPTQTVAIALPVK